MRKNFGGVDLFIVLIVHSCIYQNIKFYTSNICNISDFLSMEKCKKKKKSNIDLSPVILVVTLKSKRIDKDKDWGDKPCKHIK